MKWSQRITVTPLQDLADDVEVAEDDLQMKLESMSTEEVETLRQALEVEVK